jgi:hypothetical protein
MQSTFRTAFKSGREAQAAKMFNHGPLPTRKQGGSQQNLSNFFIMKTLLSDQLGQEP